MQNDPTQLTLAFPSPPVTKLTLPTLYSRRTDGGIQQWTIEVEGNKYRTTQGKMGGSLRPSDWTECEAMNVGRANEISAENQAIAKAQSEWKKKKDRKYSDSIDKVDSDAIYQCMLALDVRGKWDKEKKEWVKAHWPRILDAFNNGTRIFVQKKLDGIRCIANKDGLWSREGKQFTSCPHIVRALKPLFDGQPDLILDGELFNEDLIEDFNKIVSLVKKQKPSLEEMEETAAVVQYHIYDVPTVDEVFEARCRGYMALCRVVNNECVVPVETFEVSSKEEMDALYGQWLEEGHEGQIIRFNTKYENKRTNNLLKYKVYVDEEFTITDVSCGKGIMADKAARMHFVNEEGLPFEANLQFSHEQRREMLVNKDNYIGKQATVRYGNRTPDKNIPRWGRVIAIRDYE